MTCGWAFLLMLCISSCSSDPNEQLYGKWKNTDIEITMEDGSELTPELAVTTEKVVESLLADEKYYEFSAGAEKFGNYVISSLSGNSQGEYMAVEIDGKLEVALFEKDDMDSEDVKDASKIVIDDFSESSFKSSLLFEGMNVIFTYTKQ